jgi:hypothetical protein
MEGLSLVIVAKKVDYTYRSKQSLERAPTLSKRLVRLQGLKSSFEVVYVRMAVSKLVQETRVCCKRQSQSQSQLLSESVLLLCPKDSLVGIKVS